MFDWLVVGVGPPFWVVGVTLVEPWGFEFKGLKLEVITVNEPEVGNNEPLTDGARIDVVENPDIVLLRQSLRAEQR